MLRPSYGKFCTHCGAQVLTKHGKPAKELYDEDLFKKSNILKLVRARIPRSLLPVFLW